jgi:hypothetical protein
MLLEQLGDTIILSFQEMSAGAIAFIPNLVISLIILLAGWIVGMVLGKVVMHIVDGLKVDQALKGAGVEEFLQRAGFSLSAGAFLGALVRWFVIIVFLIASLDIIGLTQVTVFLQEVVLLYVPQVIVAVLILIVAAMVADAVQRLVVGAAKAGRISSAHFLGTVARYAIWIFAILTALFQLGVAGPFIQTLFTGVIIAFSLAVGLAFGLGGQYAAAEYIEKLKRDFTHRGEN